MRTPLLHAGSGRSKEHIMAKGQQKKSKEARKPKKVAPPKANASAPSSKGTLANFDKD
jgi:hypothetical protein